MSSSLSRLIGSLTVGRKLALIYFLDLTTVLFISGILINEKYIAIDFTNKEIVGVFGLSDKTVKNYLRNAMGKLNPSRRVQVAALYVWHGHKA